MFFMKLIYKIFLSLFVLLLIFSNFSKIRAQGLQDTFNGQHIPGITCGDASIEEINQCCSININSNIEIKDPRFWCLPLGGPCASSLPKNAFDGFFKNSDALTKIKELADLAKEGNGCVVGEASNPGSSDCKCKVTALSNFCNKYFNEGSSEKVSCLRCVAGNNGVWTSFGCFGTSVSSFTSSIFSILLSLAGFLTLLCIIISAFMLQTSSGNPERIKKARQYLTSCIAGLLLIIFSIFILRLVGVFILKIPGIV